MWFIYILKCADNNYYVGQTSNLPNRLLGHLSGNGTVFTRQHKPESLYYVETVTTRDEAIQRETALMRQFKTSISPFVLDERYQGLFERITEFISKHGDDCWYRIRDGSISQEFKEAMA